MDNMWGRQRDLSVIIHVSVSQVDDETWNLSHHWNSLHLLRCVTHDTPPTQHEGCFKHCNVVMVVQMPEQIDAIVYFK